MKATSRKKGRLYVGTSGWSYGWGEFYPPDIASRDYLGFYSRRFPSVEINYSFYHLPRPSTYQAWAAQTPRGFVFAVKLSRYVTHIKRLSEVRDELVKFFVNASSLGSKLGPILVQLPPSLKADVERLDEFLAAAKEAREKAGIETTRLALEFRHRSWFDPPQTSEAARVLEKHRAAFVFSHSSRYPYPDSEPVTADFVYLRFHGPEKMFASPYGKAKLSPWAPKVKRWLREGLDVYAYFNNDVCGYAVHDARALLELARRSAR